MTEVETLRKFFTQAITCDNRLFERCQEKQFGWVNVNHNMISTSLASEKNALDPKPI
jgi:hypothetical protein